MVAWIVKMTSWDFFPAQIKKWRKGRRIFLKYELQNWFVTERRSTHQLAVASKKRLKVNNAEADSVSLLILLLFYAVKQRRGKNSLQGHIKVAPKTFFAFRQLWHWTSSCNEVNGQVFCLELLWRANWLSKLIVWQFFLVKSFVLVMVACHSVHLTANNFILVHFLKRRQKFESWFMGAFINDDTSVKIGFCSDAFLNEVL